jgi:glycine cleavage system H protein
VLSGPSQSGIIRAFFGGPEVGSLAMQLFFWEITGMSKVPADLKYAKTHEWAKLESDGTVKIGITDHAQSELGDLVYVELPEVGRKVEAGEECAVVESVKAASDLYSPVSGEVSAINDAVVDAPESVNQDAYATWLFSLRPDSVNDLDNLLDFKAYAELIDE